MIALFGSHGCSRSTRSGPDRILLVTIDTLRADHVGCYGALRAHTPRLDAIAARGVRFDVAISPVPLTLPAHASLMTALDPPAHGVRHNSIYRLGDGIPTLADALRGAGYATAAFVGAVVLDRRFGLARGFDVYDDEIGTRRSGDVGYAERPADAVVDAALSWLDGAPDRFFLWLHFYDPHRGFDPPPGFAAAFANDPYAGEIAFADSQLGRLLDALQERWGPDGLLVAVTSDHGESLGEHGEIAHSYTIYDATQRVPLILAGAGLPAGREVTSLVRLIDVAPTLLALAGAPPLPEAEGRDLLPLVEGRESRPREAYIETLATQIDFHWSPLLGLRTRDVKYVRAPVAELYDLVADPGELANRAAREPQRAAEWDARLEARLAREPVPAIPVEVSAEERARLERLGYAVVSPSPRLALGRVGGPDPKRHMGVLRDIGRAEVWMGQGQAARALALLREVEGGGPQVAALRAAAAVTAGDLAEAERSARLVLADQPQRSDMLTILGRSLAEQGRTAEARGALEAAVALDPTAAEARARLRDLGEAPGPR